MKLTSITVFNKQNYFLYENDKRTSISKSFVNHCKKIEQICLDMKERHPNNIFRMPYLEKRFVLDYFAKISKDISSENVIIYKECFFKNRLISEDNALNLLKYIFENKPSHCAIISIIAGYESVKVLNNINEENYWVPDIQSFVNESDFSPTFLSALIMSLSDAGYLIQFYEESSFRVSKVSRKSEAV